MILLEKEKRGKIKRCIHSHFKEYKSKGNRAFFWGGGGDNSKGNRVGSLHLGYTMVMKTS